MWHSMLREILTQKNIPFKIPSKSISTHQNRPKKQKNSKVSPGTEHSGMFCHSNKNNKFFATFGLRRHDSWPLPPYT